MARTAGHCPSLLFSVMSWHDTLYCTMSLPLLSSVQSTVRSTEYTVYSVTSHDRATVQSCRLLRLSLYVVTSSWTMMSGVDGLCGRGVGSLCRTMVLGPQ